MCKGVCEGGVRCKGWVGGGGSARWEVEALPPQSNLDTIHQEVAQNYHITKYYQNQTMNTQNNDSRTPGQHSLAPKEVSGGHSPNTHQT